MFPTTYMHQFGWLSERGGNFLNFQKEGGTQKGRVLSEKGGSNPGGNYRPKITPHLDTFHIVMVCEKILISAKSHSMSTTNSPSIS